MTQRSPKQNKSYWKALGWFADDMNDAGYDFKAVVHLPVSFTPENIHQYMFKPVMSIMYPEFDSTTELDTVQMQKVYDVFNAAMAVKFQISHDWPSDEAMLREFDIQGE